MGGLEAFKVLWCSSLALCFVAVVPPFPPDTFFPTSHLSLFVYLFIYLFMYSFIYLFLSSLFSAFLFFLSPISFYFLPSPFFFSSFAPFFLPFSSPSLPCLCSPSFPPSPTLLHLISGRGASEVTNTPWHHCWSDTPTRGCVGAGRTFVSWGFS